MLYGTVDRPGLLKALFPNVPIERYLALSRTHAELGRVGLENGAYANFEEYAPRSVSKFECHRKFADIQIVLAGSEYIEVCPEKDLLPCTFNEERDICFHSDRPDLCSRVHMTPGHFLLLMPEDAHKPCMSDGSYEGTVRKCVIKLPVLDCPSFDR